MSATDSNPGRAGAVIVAAGGSRRMGFDKMAALLRGVPVVAHAVRAFERCPGVGAIVLVGREEGLGWLRELVRREGWKKISATVPGGNERQESVARGLEALGEEVGLIAVHDGARPLVTPEAVARCIEAVEGADGAALATPVADTLKRGDAGGWVVGGVERAGLWAMATPQVFRAETLREAYRRIGEERVAVTDEVSAVERIGGRVRLVENGGWNFKITRPEDLPMAELVLAAREEGR